MSLVLSTGKFFFKWRDKLPVPLVLAMLSLAKPSRITWLLGLPFVFIGELLRLWGLMHIGPTTRTRNICADRLVTSGPYAHCRNPLYLANFLKIIGFIIIAGNPIYALAVMLFYLTEFSTMIPYEESFLAEKFPEQHEKYRKIVPIFLPSLYSKHEFDNKSVFSFSDALKSEKKTFLSTLSILTLLFFTDLKKQGKKI